jgi:hypothetical protein
MEATIKLVTIATPGKRKKVINVRENRRENQECTIQRHWQLWMHKTQNEDKQNKKKHRKLKR